MKPQIGGLKLVNPNKKGFQPVYDMINNGSLEYFTVNSLKGFMVTLDVLPGHSEYYNLSSTGARFINPVKSFILKFAILTEDDNTRLPSYIDEHGEHIGKSSESQDSYYEEAKLQQHIWIESIIGGRPAICPPVANLSMFNNYESKKLLQFLQSKTSGRTQNIFNYLYKYVSDKNNALSGIGVIVMPKIENSFTFADFYDNNDEDKINEAYISIAAQIARLFIHVGVIHFDLHMKNALLYRDDKNVLKCVLIDFGRASDINNRNADDYLTINDKQALISIKNESEKTLLSAGIDSEGKVKLINDVLGLISKLDKFKNQQLYHYDKKESYQMDWYEEFRDLPVLQRKVFDLLYANHKTDGVSNQRKTINKYTNEGNLINFNNDVNYFIVSFPSSIPTIDLALYANDIDDDCKDDKPGCVITGGRKSKIYKKNKKLKNKVKTRRNKKTTKYSRV